MTFDNLEELESDATPIVHFEHEQLPRIAGEEGTVCCPFRNKTNLIFASAEEEKRWKENVSPREGRAVNRASKDDVMKVVKDVALFGLCISLAFLIAFLGEALFAGQIQERWWIISWSIVASVCAAFLLRLTLRVDEDVRRRKREVLTYRVFNLNHPMFPKNSPLEEYRNIIFALRNMQSRPGSNWGCEERRDASAMPLDTGVSTRRMLEEYEKHLGMAGEFAELWPDADQPTREAIVADMNRQSETLRTACANYQADADQIATIDREKQDYLDQKHTEAEAILAEAKAAETAEEHKRIRAQYGF